MHSRRQLVLKPASFTAACSLLQYCENTSIIGPGCAGLTPGSADRTHRVARPGCRAGSAAGPSHYRTLWLYSRSVNEAFFAELSEWLTQAGLAGMSETDIVSGFCDRCVEAGLPLARALMFIDTLHPVHEGRLFRWGYGPTESPLLEYGRTSPEALAASGYPWMWSRPNAGGTAHTTRCCKLATRFCAAA
jgi:hypothetical protein